MPPVGGSVGTGPWASAGDGRQASGRDQSGDAATAATERRIASSGMPAWSHEPAARSSRRLPPIPPERARPRAPGRMAAVRPWAVGPRLLIIGRRAPSPARRPLEDLDVELPQVAHLADRDLRPRRRRRDRRTQPRPGRARASTSSRRARSSSVGSFRRSRSRPRAPQIRDLYTIVFLIAVAIFIVVEGLIIWSVIRYRRKPGDDTLPPQTHGNNIAEFVWTIVPTILVIFMFVISWQTLNSVDTASANAQTKIRAVAGQFQWTSTTSARTAPTILYTELIAAGQAGGGMNVPAGRTVQLSLRQQRRHPRLLRPAVPVQARRRPGPDQPVRLHGQRVAMPARRSAASAPSCAAPATHHAVRRQGADRRRLRRLAGREGRQGQRHARRRPRAGGPGETLKLDRQGRQVTRRPRSRPRPTRRSRSTSRTRTRACRTTSRSTRDRRPARRSSRARSSPASPRKIYDVPALPAGPYGFVCTVHPNMTGTLTVQ